MGQTTPPHATLGIVSDWTHRHVLFPDSNDYAAMAKSRTDPRWVHNWFLRHPEAWWPQRRQPPGNKSQRDWSLSLVGSPSTYGFEPVFNYTFSISSQAGYGALNTTDIGNGEFLATAGHAHGDRRPGARLISSISRWTDRSRQSEREVLVR